MIHSLSPSQLEAQNSGSQGRYVRGGIVDGRVVVDIVNKMGAMNAQLNAMQLRIII